MDRVMRRSPVLIAGPSESTASPLPSRPETLQRFGDSADFVNTAAVCPGQKTSPALPPRGSWSHAEVTPSPGRIVRTLSAGSLRPRASAGPRAAGGGSMPPTTAHRSRLSAPSGYSESEMSDAATPSFSMQVPSGWTDDEDDGEEVVSSRRRSSVGAGVRPLSPAEAALAQLTAVMEEQLRLSTQRKVAVLERELAEIDAAEAEAVAAVAVQQAAAAQAVADAEAAAVARRAQERAQLLSGLRSEHRQSAAEGQRKVEAAEQQARIQAEEEARRKAAAAAAVAAAAEAEHKAKEAAAVAKQAAEAQQKIAAEAQQAAAAEKAAAEQQAAQQQQQQQPNGGAAASKDKEGGPAPVLRIAASAAAWERECAKALAAAQEAVKPFVEDRSMRDKKRSIDKFVTLNVQQISATLEQVRRELSNSGCGPGLCTAPPATGCRPYRPCPTLPPQVRNKSQALCHFMAQQHGNQKMYALLTLAGKLLSQCEVQVRWAGHAGGSLQGLAWAFPGRPCSPASPAQSPAVSRPSNR